MDLEWIPAGLSTPTALGAWLQDRGGGTILAYEKSARRLLKMTKLVAREKVRIG